MLKVYIVVVGVVILKVVFYLCSESGFESLKTVKLQLCMNL